MASLHLENGRFRITWPQPGDKKGCLRTGLTKDQSATARTIHRHVERLLDAKDASDAVPADTAAWVRGLPDKPYARLAKQGLVPPRERVADVTLGQLWDRFLAAKTCKAGTRVIYNRVRTSFEAHFGKDIPITAIGVEQAEGWCKTLADAGFAIATRSKHTHVAKGLFRRAVLWGLLSRSPFESIRPGPQTNAKRQAYIPVSDLEKILAAAPSHDWRCIFGLARLAGLRCPSEIVGLQWGHVDFEARRMIVHSPKTEHHAEGATRIVPIVPRLHDILMAAFTAAEPGTVYVVPKLRQPDTNLRTHAHRILTRAGVVPPPKVFVNCRASCATDWARDCGGAAAAKWCGHSPLIALRHYAQVRPEDFARATGTQTEAHLKAHPNPHQSGREPIGADGKKLSETPAKQAEIAVCATASGGEEWAILDSNQYPAAPDMPPRLAGVIHHALRVAERWSDHHERPGSSEPFDDQGNTSGVPGRSA